MRRIRGLYWSPPVGKLPMSLPQTLDKLLEVLLRRLVGQASTTKSSKLTRSSNPKLFRFKVGKRQASARLYKASSSYGSFSI